MYYLIIILATEKSGEADFEVNQLSNLLRAISLLLGYMGQLVTFKNQTILVL